MLNNQILAWILSVSSGDIKNENRQKHRIDKTTDTLSSLNIPQEQVDLINGIFDMAERKTGRAIENRVKPKI